MNHLRPFWGAVSKAMNAVLVPVYSLTDGEFRTSKGPDGQIKVSHVKTAAANKEAARRELKAGHPLAAAKDAAEAVFHSTWATINRATGLDRKLGMDAFERDR